MALVGLMPRDYLLSVMRNERNPQPVRINCAIAAAPFCHPRLTSMDATVYARLSAETTRTTLDASVMDAEDRTLLLALIASAVGQPIGGVEAADSEPLYAEFSVVQPADAPADTPSGLAPKAGDPPA